MQAFSISPLQLLNSFVSHRQLILAMTRREVVGRYRGSMLGILWSFFHPVVMLTIYTFVFSVVFKARWGDSGESKSEFAIILFAGLIVYTVFAECANRAPSLILANANYVKKVVFPLEILPWVALGSTLFHAAVSLLVWLGFYLMIHGTLHWTVLLLPLVLLPLLLLTMGVSWLLASLGVYLRDVAQTVGLVTTIMLFVSPVFFPAQALDAAYRPLLYANPLTFIIEQARAVLIWGRPPDWPQLAAYAALSLVVCWLGFAWFQKTRKGFADVL